jgi:hypothetical protein
MTFREYLETWRESTVGVELTTQARKYLSCRSEKVYRSSVYWRFLRRSDRFKADCDRILGLDVSEPPILSLLINPESGDLVSADSICQKWGIPDNVGPSLLCEIEFNGMLAFDLAFKFQDQTIWSWIQWSGNGAFYPLHHTQIDPFLPLLCFALTAPKAI